MSAWSPHWRTGKANTSPSGRRFRNKGARTARSIVNALQASGLPAVRVPLSGAVGGRFPGDIVLPLRGRDLCVEVKVRADGFRELYCSLNQRDIFRSLWWSFACRSQRRSPRGRRHEQPLSLR
jgi:hypothetical protein